MRNQWHRLVLAALASIAVVSGGVSVLLSVTHSSAESSEDHVIDIINTGFNPEVCYVDRADTFRFINKTSSVQHVLSNQNEFLDTGPIQPGETSKGFNFHFIGSQHFYLESHPEFTGEVITDHGRHCDPLPPTPTPTNTPTATPTVTPSPTPIPTPDGRKGLIPSIAREE